MSEKYNLGAIDVDTQQYTLPEYANKIKKYECIDCKQPVILRKGKIRKAHFAHHTSVERKCSYYDHPNESQLHKEAKYKLQDKLNKKFPIQFNSPCPICTSWPAALDDYQIEYLEGDTAVVEYRDPSNKFIADVALINNGKIRYIFEIKHTHATITNVRPEPWFEIQASEIFEEEERVKHPESDNYIGDLWSLECIRKSMNRYCDNCRIIIQPWAENLPRLPYKNGMNQMWKQVNPCIECKREQYNPVFIKGFPRQICKICLGPAEAKLKEKYNVPPKCLIEDDD